MKDDNEATLSIRKSKERTTLKIYQKIKYIFIGGVLIGMTGTAYGAAPNISDSTLDMCMNSMNSDRCMFDIIGPPLPPPPTMCAIVNNASNTTVAAFCQNGNKGRTCVGSTVTCTNDDSTDRYRTSLTGLAKYPWYQAAIFWARQNGHRNVRLSPGTIYINSSSRLYAGNFGYIGILVPSNINLQGSTDLTKPTYIVESDANPNPGKDPVSTRLQAMLLVSEDSYRVPQGRDHNKSVYRIPTSNSEISYLQISGVSQPPTDCSTFPFSMKTIHDTDVFSPPEPTRYDRWKVQAYFGILVDQTDGAAGNIDIHHVKIAHVIFGLQLGWANAGFKANPTCSTNSCLRLSYTMPINGTCSNGQIMHLDVVGGKRCVVKSVVPNCVPTYCKMAKFPYIGSPTAWGSVKNSSICDADQGLSAAYASNVNIYNNFVLGIKQTTTMNSNAGIWTGGANANVYYNLVTYGDYGYASDGSNFASIDLDTYQKVTGFSQNATGFSPEDYQNLGQFIAEDSTKVLLKSDPYGGFGYNTRVVFNKFHVFKHSAVSLVRQNWSWVGANYIFGLGSGSNGSFNGIQLIDAMNSYLYGNTIKNTPIGVSVTGKPGVDSLLGSVYNSCYQYYDVNNKSWLNWPNTFSDIPQNWSIDSKSMCVH